jgi:hypothetical protein
MLASLCTCTSVPDQIVELHLARRSREDHIYVERPYVPTSSHPRPSRISLAVAFLTVVGAVARPHIRHLADRAHDAVLFMPIEGIQRR